MPFDGCSERSFSDAACVVAVRGVVVAMRGRGLLKLLLSLFIIIFIILIILIIMIILLLLLLLLLLLIIMIIITIFTPRLPSARTATPLAVPGSLIYIYIYIYVYMYNRHLGLISPLHEKSPRPRALAVPPRTAAKTTDSIS